MKRIAALKKFEDHLAKQRFSDCCLVFQKAWLAAMTHFPREFSGLPTIINELCCPIW